ncbi:hypothetical protein Efla_004440 [Eimeria flavescens]
MGIMYLQPDAGRASMKDTRANREVEVPDVEPFKHTGQYQPEYRIAQAVTTEHKLSGGPTALSRTTACATSGQQDVRCSGAAFHAASDPQTYKASLVFPAEVDDLPLDSAVLFVQAAACSSLMWAKSIRRQCACSIE